MNVADEKKAIQEMANHSQKWHNRTSTRRRSTGTSDGLAAIQAQLNNNLGREIKKLTNDCYEEINVLDSVTYGVFKEGRRMEDQALADLGASVSVMPLTTFTNLGLGDLSPTKLTIELADRTIKYPKDVAENVLVGIELRRNQVEDLGPTIGEGEVIDEPMIDIIKTRNNESFDEYPIFVTLTERSSYNLRFSCMIVKNMDGYRDQEMGDIIFGEPFYKASCVEARRPLLKELAEECNVISGILIFWNYYVRVVRARIQTLLHTQSCS
ncbi:hypothetical protein Tco_0998777 [Tanacetum coccineum]